MENTDVVSMYDNPEVDDCRPFAKMFVEELLRLVSVSQMVQREDQVLSGAVEEMVEVVETILLSVSSLSLGLVSLDSRAVPLEFGKIEALLNRLRSSDFNNFSALSLSCNVLALQLKDSVRELNDLLASSPPSSSSSSSSLSSSKDGEEEEEWDMLTGVGSVSEENRPVVSSCATCLKVVASYADKMSRVLVQFSQQYTERHLDQRLFPQQEGFSTMKELDQVLEALLVVSDDLAAFCFYPDLDLPTLRPVVERYKVLIEDLYRLSVAVSLLLDEPSSSELKRVAALLPQLSRSAFQTLSSLLSRDP